MNARQSLIDALFYDRIFSKCPEGFQTVLDVGSGGGKMVDYFTRKGKHAKGVDLHPARQDIQKMDFMQNGLEDASYDLVYTAHLLEHMPDNEAFARELVRVAKKYVCVMTPLPTKQFWDQPDHIRPYTKEALRRLFHVPQNKVLYWSEINLPFFEPVAIILFARADSKLAQANK